MSKPNETGTTRRGFLQQTAVAAIGLSVSMQAVGCSQIQITREHAYDILIRNGQIYDGTHSNPYFADIGIKGDRIVAIGDLDNDAATVIDADEKVITPGFIDIHTHCDLTFKKAGNDTGRT